MEPELFVDPVPNHFLCSICLGVVKNPVEHIDCDNLFCKGCCVSYGINKNTVKKNCPLCVQPMNKRMKKMNRYVREDYEKLVMRCPYAGCTETFSWNKQEQHERECSKGPREECQHCREMIHPKFSVEHHKQCDSFPLKCTHYRCNATVARRGWEEHVAGHNTPEALERDANMRKIEQHLHLLSHAAWCNEACSSANCRKMKVRSFFYFRKWK